MNYERERQRNKLRKCVTLLLLFSLCTQLAEAANQILLNKIVLCESSSRPSVCGDDGVSCGIAQFKRKTFYYMATLAIKDGSWTKELGTPRWMSESQQVFLLNWALDTGRGWNWTCYKFVTQIDKVKWDKRAKGEW